jgi:hypothetical protein
MGKPTTNSTKKTTARKGLPKNGAAHPPVAAAAAAPAPAPAPVAIPAPEARPRRAAKAARAAEPKPERKKAATKRTTTAQKRTVKSQSPAARASYSQEDVALRAYFIGERRQQTGTPGSPESDWLEAEQQLRAEYGA